MADSDQDNDKEDLGTRILYGVTTMSAAFVARKLLMAAWTKATGKKPPTNPEDPRVALTEALGWSVLVGITVAAVRVLAARAISRKTLGSAGEEPVSAAKSLGRALAADKLAIAVFGKLAAVVHKEAPRTRELISLTRDHPERELLVRQVRSGQLQGFGNIVGVKVDSAR
jgi:Protein of unknown function (DUF4235)